MPTRTTRIGVESVHGTCSARLQELLIVRIKDLLSRRISQHCCGNAIVGDSTAGAIYRFNGHRQGSSALIRQDKQMPHTAIGAAEHRD
jgi:hypothetical protein